MHTDALPLLKADEYPGGLWYYEPHTYQPYRYVLGRVGRHPLVCIGINPSTAQPGALDPTLKVWSVWPTPTILTAGSCSTCTLSVPPTPTTWTVCRTAPCVTRTCAGCRPCWPRPNPPCGRLGHPDRKAGLPARPHAGDGGPDPGKEHSLGDLWQAQQKRPPAPPAVPSQRFHTGALRCGKLSGHLFLISF